MYFGYALNEPDTLDVILQISVTYILHLENKPSVCHIQNKPMNDQRSLLVTVKGFSLVLDECDVLGCGI